MRIVIELDEQDEKDVISKILERTAALADTAIANYFQTITPKDFSSLLRRALRTSCDSFFQQYMQYYAEKMAPELLRKLKRDCSNRDFNIDDAERE